MKAAALSLSLILFSEHKENGATIREHCRRMLGVMLLNVGELIWYRRSVLGLTRREVGEALGYKGGAARCIVWRWEHCLYPVPVQHIRRLAHILELPLDVLIPKADDDSVIRCRKRSFSSDHFKDPPHAIKGGGA